ARWDGTRRGADAPRHGRPLVDPGRRVGRRAGDAGGTAAVDRRSGRRRPRRSAIPRRGADGADRARAAGAGIAAPATPRFSAAGRTTTVTAPSAEELS